MNEEITFNSVEQMIDEADKILRKGFKSFSEWSEQARKMVQERPGVLLAATGISGLFAGAMLRQSALLRRRSRGRRPGQGPGHGPADRPLPVDPLILVASGLAAGLLIGPKVLEQIFADLDRHLDEERERFATEMPLKPTGTANEKPFERF